MTATPGPVTLASPQAAASVAPGARHRASSAVAIPFSVLIIAIVSVACLAVIPPQVFDFPIVLTFNTLARRSALLDHSMHMLTSVDLLQGVVFVAMLWYLWFENPQVNARARLMTGTVAASCAGVASRLMQIALPTHLRPVHTAALGFVRPLGVDPDVLNHFYSFPSDHGALLFGLALVIYVANRRLGVAAFAWAVVVDAARVYEGYHFPSDIVGAIGLAVAMICIFHNRWFHQLARIVVRKGDTGPAIFYTSAFVISYQIATLFDDVREIGRGFAHIVLHHGVLGG